MNTVLRSLFSTVKNREVMMTNVLIIGGYGMVGRLVAEELVSAEGLRVIVAGRDGARARELAVRLGVDWRQVDITDRLSLAAGLTEVQITINCFSGPFTHFPLDLPRLCAERGIHYLDVSGSYDYTSRLLEQNDLAARNQAILISALGANPGIPGITLMDLKEDFDHAETARVEFVMGARLDGVSLAGLKELKYMLDVKPKVWQAGGWYSPRPDTRRVWVDKPFNRKIYLGASLTRDLLPIPGLTGLNDLSFWSGFEDDVLGLALIAGLKLSLTRWDVSGRFLLNTLKRMGRKKECSGDILLKIEMTGLREGVRQNRVVRMLCEENLFTALAPAAVCRQLAAGTINRCGAFVPPEIVPASDFMSRLRRGPVHYSITAEGL